MARAAHPATLLRDFGGYAAWVATSLPLLRPHLLQLAFPLWVATFLDVLACTDADAAAVATADLPAPDLAAAAAAAATSSTSAHPRGAAGFSNSLAAARYVVEAYAPQFGGGVGSSEVTSALALITLPEQLLGAPVPATAADRRAALSTLPSRVAAAGRVVGGPGESGGTGALSDAFSGVSGGGGSSGVATTTAATTPAPAPAAAAAVLARFLDPRTRYHVAVPAVALTMTLDALARAGALSLLAALNERVVVDVADTPLTAAAATTGALAPGARPGFLPSFVGPEVLAGVARTAEVATARGVAPPAGGPDTVRWGVPSLLVRSGSGASATAHLRSFAGGGDVGTIPWPDYFSTAYGRALLTGAPASVPPTAAAAAAAAASDDGGSGSTSAWSSGSLSTVSARVPGDVVTAAAGRELVPSGANGGAARIVAAATDAGALLAWVTLSAAAVCAPAPPPPHADADALTLTLMAPRLARAGAGYTCVAVSQCGQFLLAGTTGGEVALFSVAAQVAGAAAAARAALGVGGAAPPARPPPRPSTTMEPLAVYPHASGAAPVWSVAFCPLTPKVFASAGRDGTAKLWSTAAAAPQLVFAGHSGDVEVVAFHPNGMYLVTGGADGGVRVWDAVTSDLLRLCVGHATRVTAVAVVPSGRFLVSGDAGGDVRVWDVPTGAPCAILRGHARGARLTSLTLHPAGRLLATGDATGRVCVWNMLLAVRDAGSVDAAVALVQSRVAPALSTLTQPVAVAALDSGAVLVLLPGTPVPAAAPDPHPHKSALGLVAAAAITPLLCITAAAT